MLRKRALWGVVALVLALGLFTATGAQAAEGPSRGLTGFWTSVEVWFQDLVAGWFGEEPTATTSKTDDSPELLPPTNPPTGPFGPGTQDGSGDVSTTDEGPGSDPNG
jgi:hypothetical protein